jgi:hypothetical protein
MNVFNNPESSTKTQNVAVATNDSSSANSYGEGLQDFLAGFGVLVFILIAIHIFIFVTWMRSMFSMIHLDQRFNDFFDEYKFQQDRVNPLPGDKPAVRHSVVIEPLENDSDNKKILSWSEPELSKPFIYTLSAVGGVFVVIVIILIILSIYSN